MQNRNCRLGGHLVGQAANGAVLAPSPSRQAPPFVGPGKWKVIMAGYYLFFRCWPGFTEPFPFDRFDSLPDDELAKALDAFAREQIRAEKPAIKRISRERKRKLGRKPSRIQPPWKPPNAQRQHYDYRIRGASRRDKLVCRVGAYLGWWKTSTTGSLAGIIVGNTITGSRVGLLEVADQDLAEHLVAELNSQPGLDCYEWNPRFSYLASEGFSTSERASIQRQINSIRDGQQPAVRDGTASLFIGKLYRQVATDAAKAWAQVTSGKTEATNQQKPEEAAAADGTGEEDRPEQPVSKGSALNGIPAKPGKPAGGPSGKVKRSVTAAGDYIGVSASTIRRWIKGMGGSISAEPVEDGLYRFDQAELDRLRATQKARRDRLKTAQENKKNSPEKTR